MDGRVVGVKWEIADGDKSDSKSVGSGSNLSTVDASGNAMEGVKFYLSGTATRLKGF